MQNNMKKNILIVVLTLALIAIVFIGKKNDIEKSEVEKINSVFVR
jgi:FtsZ-interacting cell division protein ZipA